MGSSGKINLYAKMQFLEQLDIWIDDRERFYKETKHEPTLELINSLKETRRNIEMMNPI